MILLKYAKLLPLDATENIWDVIKMPNELKQILLYRVKEFVVCGHTIDAKEAILLTTDERVALYNARTEWEKEKASIPKLFTPENIEKGKEYLDGIAPSMPITEDDLIQEYLLQSVEHYG